MRLATPIIALLSLLWVGISPAPATEQVHHIESWPEGVYVTSVGIGEIPVILKPTPTAPVVEVELWVRAGSLHEPAPIRGISHYLEHLFYRGTPRRAALANRLEIIDVGGITTAGTWYDWTYYRNKVPAAELERGIDTLTDALMDLTLTWESVEAERSVVGSEIRLRQDDPGIYAWERSLNLLFGTHPYGEHIIGDFDTTGRITQEDFRDYYKRHYHPNNVALVLVGDFEPSEALDMLEERLGLFIRPGEPNPPAELATRPLDAPPAIVVESRAQSEATLTLSFQFPGFTDPLRPAAEVLSHALVERDDSYLDHLRQEGLASRVSASYTVLTQAGALVITLAPAEGTTLPELARAALARIDTAAEDLPTALIDSSRTALLQAAIRGRATTDQQAYALGEAWTQGDFASYWTHREDLAAVTATDVRHLAASLLAQNQSALLALANDTALAEAGGATALEAELFQAMQLLHRHGAGVRLMPTEGDTLKVAPVSAIPAPTPVKPRMVLIEADDRGTPLMFRQIAGAHETVFVVASAMGSAHESAPGLLDCTLALLEHGGSQSPRDQLLGALAALGGSLHTVVERGQSRIELSVPAALSTEGAQFLRLLLTPQPGQFSEIAILTAQSTQLSERKGVRDDIRRAATQGLWETAFADSPYAHDPKGTRALLEPPSQPLTPDQARATWHAFRQMTRGIVVSGDFDTGAVQSELLQLQPLFMPDPAIAWEPPPTPTTGAFLPGLHRFPQERAQSAVYLIGRSPTIGDRGPDSAAALVLMRGLGLRNFRDLIYAKALAYSSSATLLDAGEAGAIALFAYVDPSREKEARLALFAKVEEVIADGFPPEELQNIKGWWLGSLDVGSEDQGTMARRIGDYLATGFSWNHEAKFRRAIAEVTNEDVMRVAAEVFAETAEVIAGPVAE